MSKRGETLEDRLVTELGVRVNGKLMFPDIHAPENKEFMEEVADTHALSSHEIAMHGLIQFLEASGSWFMAKRLREILARPKE